MNIIYHIKRLNLYIKKKKSDIIKQLTDVEKASPSDKFLIIHKFEIFFGILSLLSIYKLYLSLTAKMFDALRMFWLFTTSCFILMFISCLISFILNKIKKRNIV